VCDPTAMFPSICTDDPRTALVRAFWINCKIDLIQARINVTRQGTLEDSVGPKSRPSHSFALTNHGEPRRGTFSFVERLLHQSAREALRVRIDVARLEG
jgi:hypothetical protein